MKTKAAMLAGMTLLFSASLTTVAPLKAATVQDTPPGYEKVEECRALFEELGGDQPFGDCVQYFSGGQSPASVCRILIFLDYIEESDLGLCVMQLSKP